MKESNFFAAALFSSKVNKNEIYDVERNSINTLVDIFIIRVFARENGERELL